MPCMSSTGFRTTNLVDVNCTVTVINQRRLAPMLLTTPRIAYSCGRKAPWRMDTRVKASEPETSRSIIKRNFYLPCLHLGPVGVIPPEYRRDLLHHKTIKSLGAIVPRCLRDPTFSRFGTTPTYDRRTDERTDGRTRCDDSIYRASIASRR